MLRKNVDNIFPIDYNKLLTNERRCKVVDLKQLQRDIIANKKEKGFNTTDVNMEFCLTYGEMAEAYDAWLKKKSDLGEELADVAIFLLGLAEILNFDLEKEIAHKMEKNKNRKYILKDGVYIKENA